MGKKIGFAHMTELVWSFNLGIALVPKVVITSSSAAKKYSELLGWPCSGPLNASASKW